MRTAIFFDGKNFYSGWCETTDRAQIDFEKLTDWLVERVGGSSLWGVNYYTGVEPNREEEDPAAAGLARFLNHLEMVRGFFVHRFPRKSREVHCPNCEEAYKITNESMVDTTVVADMLRLAAVDAFDVAILVSGDVDHYPAVEGVRLLGKSVYLAGWSGTGLSPRLRRQAFDYVDLLEGLDKFRRDESGYGASSNGGGRQVDWDSDDSSWDDAEEDTEAEGADAARITLTELHTAESHFQGGFVGLNHFVSRWLSNKGMHPKVGHRVLDRLITEGLIERYPASSGDMAVRLTDEGQTLLDSMTSEA